MKILSLYAGPPRGGCYERLVRLHAALARRGAVVHVVTPAPPPEPRPGLVHHQLANSTGPVTPLRLLSASLTAARVARTEGVEGFLAFGSIYAALLLPFRRGGNLVAFLRGSWMEQEKARGSGSIRLGGVRWIEQRALAACTQVIAVSRGVAPAEISPMLIPNDAPEPHLVDRQTARAALNLPPDAFIAGSLGLPTPIKCLETVVDGVRLTRAAHVAISGFGSSSAYEASLRTRSADLVEAGRAHLLGWVDRNVFLSAIDILVVASRHEGSPNGLLEGLAAGIPCLGSRAPGVEETLGDDAMLFPFGDAPALAVRLEELAASSEARADLALRCRERSRHYRFDWDDVASNAVLRALQGERISE